MVPFVIVAVALRVPAAASLEAVKETAWSSPHDVKRSVDGVAVVPSGALIVRSKNSLVVSKLQPGSGVLPARTVADERGSSAVPAVLTTRRRA